MKITNLMTLLFLTGMVSCFNPDAEYISFSTNSLILSLSRSGQIIALTDKNSNSNYSWSDTIAPILTMKADGRLLYPERITFADSILTVIFPDAIEAQLKVVEKKSHLTLEIQSVTESKPIELVVWGPYPTTLNKVIGETIGVVQGEDFSLGLQALNPKTLGGYPWTDNDCMPQFDIFEAGDYSDMNASGKREVLYRVEAAKPEKFGSSLQAYCRNRNSERIISNLDHEKYVSPTFQDGGIIGSKIAIFGCPVGKTLETIAEIEVEEGLPHPLIDGEWGKTSRSASSAYLIYEFNEKNIDQAIACTKQAGLKYLYHPGPFKNWGHFELNEAEFPNGWDGLKACIEKAKAEGIYVGLHTLSNFITTNDPYVTPVPNDQLGKVGTSKISGDINESQKEIAIHAPDFFNQYKNNNLMTVKIGSELIRYGKVSEQAPWKLLDCQRGAFGTRASGHNRGDEIAMLADHGYKVFLTDPKLSIEMSKKIAALYNYCGLRQISFDGLEGNRSTGMGNYGEILFTTTWWDQLTDELKQHMITDASRTTHYFWHIYTRMNWGEPWYAGFRESQTEYRLKNQAYFKRNLMPAMLGWFSMRAETSVEDIEWMLARSAAFNAGYALVTSEKALKDNGYSAEILKLIGEWEKARMTNAFTEEQKKRMEDINNEFTLAESGAGQWNLTQVFSHKFKHEMKERQPGEPLFSTFNFDHRGEKQAINFILTAVDATVFSPKIVLDNYKEITLPVTLQAEESLKYNGGKTASVYSPTWQKVKEIAMDETAFLIGEGNHTLNLDCTFKANGKEPKAKLEIRLKGKTETIEAK